MWGIYLNNRLTPIATFTNVLEVHFDKNTEVTSYPLEQGSFTNVNKVNMPNKAMLKISKSGATEDIQNFIKVIDKFKDSLTLVDVVTPYEVIRSLNIISFTYSHTATEGASMLIADLELHEIRKVEARYTTYAANDPNYAAITDRGLVQPRKSTLLKISENLNG